MTITLTASNADCFRALWFQPQRYIWCNFLIEKVAVDSDDFSIKMSASVQKNDNVVVLIDRMKCKSSVLSAGEGWGIERFLKGGDILNTDNKYLSNDNTLTLIIDVSAFFYAFIKFTSLFLSAACNIPEYSTD
jgi:hypothetical protein